MDCDLAVPRPLPAMPLRNTLRPEFGILIFLQFLLQNFRPSRENAVVTGGGNGRKPPPIPKSLATFSPQSGFIPSLNIVILTLPT